MRAKKSTAAHSRRLYYERNPDIAQDISNMQWVTKAVNKMKINLTHKEFL